MEVEPTINEGGNESLLTEKVGDESHNSKVGTGEDATIGTAEENLDVIPVAASKEIDQFVVQQLKSLENKSGGNLFQNDLQVKPGSMAPLPNNKTFSVVQSPTQSAVLELTLNAASVQVVNQLINWSATNANEVSTQDSAEEAKEGEVNEQGLHENQRSMGVAGNVKSRSESSKSVKMKILITYGTVQAEPTVAKGY